MAKTTIKNATIKITHKDGNTVVNNGVVEWNFDYKMLDETVIASIVFQTIFLKFKELTMYSTDFTIDFTMEERIKD